ncbi:Hypothetical predicted protein [Octopus vulgaris]|uniref:WKF domain-containing protein n=1 Tax=Octopus vulgaris TaxID=6645 RepID=A0AA36B2U4_OCTVU|nr:Hypothetical predicted protein [Octopus vulgaris]CAI9726318.1 Hypothetical predicted protein [Octopus vulgaris]
MAKDKKTKTTEGCEKAEVNLNSSAVNKKPQKKEQKGPKESKVTEAPSQGKDKNVNAVPASDAEKKKKQQKKKPNGLKAEDGNTQNHVEGNVKAPKQKKSEENAAGELTKKKTQKQQKEATTPTPKTGQTNALKESGKNKKHNTSGGNVTDGSTGEEPVKKKTKHKQPKEETTTTAKAGQNNTSSASKENGKKKKSNNSGETLQNGSAGEEKKKKRSKRRKGSKADDKPKEMILGEDEATTEKKAKQFLNVWYTNKTEWNFVKARQNWLVHHMYDPEKIPDTTFQTLLKYLAGMKGRSREETKKQAQSLLDAVTKDKNALHKKIKLSGEPGLIQRTRAEQVIQIL